MFQSIRHVSIIVPQLMMKIDQLNVKYGAIKSKNEPKDAKVFKKDLQQALKVTSLLNFYLYNHQNLVLIQKLE